MEFDDEGGGMANYADCKNVSRVVSTIVTSNLASYHELWTVYGCQDAYDLIEILTVNAYNRARAQAAANRKA